MSTPQAADDTAALAVLAARYDLDDAAMALRAWGEAPPSLRESCRAIADAAIMAARLRQPEELRQAMAETRTLTGCLDHATQLMLDLGSTELAASARRIRKAAGLEA